MRNTKAMWALIGGLLIIVVILVSSRVFSGTEAVKRDEQDRVNRSESKAEEDRVLAKIGDRTIHYRELERYLFRVYGMEVLNQMLDREAVRMEGQLLGIRIGENEIAAELERMQYSYDSEDEFFESMKTQLGLSRDELEDDIRYRLMLEKIATADIHISDELVDYYMDTHPDEFNTGVLLHIHFIAVATLSEAEDVILQLESGADFTAVAKERSLDEITSAQGGDLGLVGIGDPLVPERVIDAALLLPPDELSRPIPLEEGFAIIKVSGRQEPTEKQLRQLKEIVRRELALSEVPPLMDVVKQLRDKWKAEIIVENF